MSFGLFPESKGYRLECRTEAKGSQLEDPDDEPDEVLYDFLEPEQAYSEPKPKQTQKLKKQPKPDDGGQTLKQVAQQIGMNYSNLCDTRDKNPEGFLGYLHLKSGRAWHYDPDVARYGKYYPVD